MLPSTPSFERIALNRVTFGATSADETTAQQMGWNAWVADQLAPPTGDDANLATFLASQTMQIQYAAADPTTKGTWTAVNEVRPLNYLNASTATLWMLNQNSGTSVSPSEVTRVSQELAAATWIRNSQSQYQLREFMTDFWQNHFNIGKKQHQYATVMLPTYDAAVIRPNVFGNFRQLLQAVATSSSMQGYLDNWLSRADVPNENYARELQELHTLGGSAYLGIVNDAAPNTQSGKYLVAAGFTDTDVTIASRALSGWTLANGQSEGKGTTLPVTGAFVYNAAQHNTQATTFLGVDISKMTGAMAQGNAVLDIIAFHPSTAAFITNKLCVRIFGDTPPQSVLTRAQNTWMSTQNAPDQIKQVLEAILTGGSEIGTGPAVKIRRPYEHLMALFRTTDMVVNANPSMTSAFDPVIDFLFAWMPPNGRPDSNAYWTNSGAILAAWNNALTWPSVAQITTNLADQTPTNAQSATDIVDYWVGRMIGAEVSTNSLNSLTTDQSGSQGVPAAMRKGVATTIESAYRRLVALIAQTPEFMYR